MNPQIHLITQGEHLALRDEAAVITTLLGSCVACCLWDPIHRAGGMNHVLLAVQASGSRLSALSGITAMERLINDLMHLGADRSRLKAKVFGGAQMISSRANIGTNNSAFVLEFLEAEGIECIGKSVGGNSARRIRFWPSSGVVRHRLVKDQDVDDTHSAPSPDNSGVVDFFR